jgi:hypothetical protein
MKTKNIIMSDIYWLIKKRLDKIGEIQKGGPAPILYPKMNEKK